MPKQIWKPSTLLAPVPAVMVTCQHQDTANILTIAWTGIVNSHPAMTYISVRPERHSYPMILESGVFAINLVTRELVQAADFCGVKSGKDINKFEACHLTPQPASAIHCPIIAESPMALECKVDRVIPLGTHDMILATIEAVDVEEDLLDENGRLCLEKCSLVAYTHGAYHALGKELGTFGFSVRKKTAAKRNTRTAK